uniref:E3 ubiquitin-protein ligase TRIM17-like n=1 Tax=Monopterus albus TaxID=43700 RepID=UPI0009B3A6E2|nr:E3 ubiquitin-protein ligase TRIM17-like [Monopterus albus]
MFVFFHNEKLEIFCQDNKEPTCAMCQTSKQHKVHECCPIVEAAQQKSRNFSHAQVFKEKAQTTEQDKAAPASSKSQTQAYQNKKMIKEEFEKLHLFLQEEENSRLKVLKQEEEVKTQVMCEKLKNVKDQTEALSSTIRDIETDLRAKDLPFLQVHLEPLYNSQEDSGLHNP